MKEQAICLIGRKSLCVKLKPVQKPDFKRIPPPLFSEPISTSERNVPTHSDVRDIHSFPLQAQCSFCPCSICWGGSCYLLCSHCMVWGINCMGTERRKTGITNSFWFSSHQEKKRRHTSLVKPDFYFPISEKCFVFRCRSPNLPHHGSLCWWSCVFSCLNWFHIHGEGKGVSRAAVVTLIAH